jgi:hypothetical protein
MSYAENQHQQSSVGDVKLPIPDRIGDDAVLLLPVYLSSRSENPSGKIGNLF